MFAEWSGLDDEALEDSYYYELGEMDGDGIGDSYDETEIGLEMWADPKHKAKDNKDASPRAPTAEVLTLLSARPRPFLLNSDLSVAFGLAHNRGESRDSYPSPLPPLD